MRFALIPVTMILAGMPLAAQNISVGVRAGVPLTDFTKVASQGSQIFSNRPDRFAIGPTMEIRLPLSLGISIDALYRRARFDTASPAPSGTESYGFWQFPVMFRVRPGVGPFRAFLGAGPSFNRLSGIASTAGCVVRLERECAVEKIKASSTGIAFGAGLEIKLPGIRLTPELRYTRLGEFVEPNDRLSTRRNQAEVLVGITF